MDKVFYDRGLTEDILRYNQDGVDEFSLLSSDSHFDEAEWKSSFYCIKHWAVK